MRDSKDASETTLGLPRLYSHTSVILRLILSKCGAGCKIRKQGHRSQMLKRNLWHLCVLNHICDTDKKDDYFTIVKKQTNNKNCHILGLFNEK